MCFKKIDEKFDKRKKNTSENEKVIQFAGEKFSEMAVELAIIKRQLQINEARLEGIQTNMALLFKNLVKQEGEHEQV